MFGTPMTPNSIKAETAYRLERTKREFRSARRRDRDPVRSPPAAARPPYPPTHHRSMTTPDASLVGRCAG